MNNYRCTVCSYTYRPAKGDPIRDIERNTDFNSLPETWRCPTCNQSKMAFEEEK